MFYDKLIVLCAERGITPTKAAEEIGMTGAHVSKWKKGSTPTDYTVAKFARFFGVPLSFFSSDSAEPITKAYDAEVEEFRQALHDRPERALLFKASKNATKEQIEAVITLLGLKEE